MNRDPTARQDGTEHSLVDLLASCVGCGLCLPHCPTFRVTGEESHSPRGRISLVRGAVERADPTFDDVREYLDTCVQCMGCEPACPSGVQYGRILSSVHRLDEESGRRPPIPVRIFLQVVRRPRILRVLARFGLHLSVSPGLRRILPSRVRVCGVPLRQGPRVRRATSEPQVWLFTGCIMDSWFRSVHRASCALLEVSGRTVGTPRVDVCCGALHAHAGDQSSARDLARRVMESMPGHAPIVVNSAGCGAMLLEYGEMLGSEEARAFSARVTDIHQWIDGHKDELLSKMPIDAGRSCSETAFIVQEPCHLRHVQHVPLADILEVFVPVVRLDDDGLCCGAGGAYSLLQPEMSGSIRRRKSDAIQRASEKRSSVVVTANPGCHLHLAAAGHSMVSAVEVIARTIGVLEDERSGGE